MSNLKAFSLPNVNVPLTMPDGFLNPPWYLFFNSLKTQANQGIGVTAVAAGDGLETDAASAGTITSSGTISLNLDFFGNSEGTLLVRGPASWQGLEPGEAGTYLESNGADQLPSWAPVTDIVPNVSPGQVLGNNQSSSEPAQDVSISSLLDICVGNLPGTIIFRGSTDWQALLPGLPNQILTSGGPFVFWADAGPAFTDRYLGAVFTVGGARVVEGISTDGTQGSGLATGVGA